MSSSAPFEPDLSLLDPWHPAETSRRLARVAAPWYVAAGWAIDLFLGGTHREHEDLEIAVPHAHFAEVAGALAGLELFVPLGDGSGRLQAVDPAGELLETHHQTWVREPETGRWRLDVFREPSQDGMWVCRRDRRLRLPYDEVIERTPAGIPYARPEIALLFKAKHAHRERDRRDLAAVLPRLDRDRRRWLAEWIERIHPGHAWLAVIR